MNEEGVERLNQLLMHLFGSILQSVFRLSGNVHVTIAHSLGPFIP